MRTKNQIHVLSGHQGTVWAMETQTTDPQVITGSSDSTVKVCACYEMGRSPLPLPELGSHALLALVSVRAVVGLGCRKGDDDADEPQEGGPSDREVADCTYRVCV